MKKIFLPILLLLFAVLASAQTPFTQQYPTGLPSTTSMGQGSDNGRSTLGATITSGATTLTVAAATSFPSVPFPITIDNEILIVTAKTGTTFTVTRHAFGTTAAAHTSGASVTNRVVWGYTDIVQKEIIAIATLLGVNAASQTHPVSASIFIGASASTNRWAVPSGDVTMDNTGAFTIANKVSANTARATIVGTTAATMTNPRDVQVDGKIAVVTNFGANQISIYDVSIPSAPTLISTISDADLNAPRQTQIQGKYLYVSNQSGNSYTVFDITNPKLPVKVVTKSGGTIASPGGIYVRGKYLYLTGTQTGAQLTVFDNTNPAVPVELGTYTPPSGEKFGRACFQGKYMYLPAQSSGPFTDDGLYIVDISNPASPSLIGRFLVNGLGTTGAPVDSSIIGNIVYELDEGGGMRIISVADPTTPTQLGYTTTGISGGSTGIWAQGRYAYVSSQINNTVVAFDVIDPTSPVVAATSAATLNVPSKLTVVGRYLYVVNRSGGTMSIVDLGQDDVAQLKAGALQSDHLAVSQGMRAGSGDIDGDFSIGRTLRIGDNLSVNGGVSITGIYTGDGSLLTALNASNLSSGTLPAGRFPILTGDIATAGGALATTLATVNSSPGSFGNASHSLTATVNGKGLITSLSSQSIAITESQVTSLVSDLAGKQSLDATLTALAAYNTNGLLTQTAADTFTGRTLTGTSNRISVSNGNGVSGNPTVDIDSAYVGQSTITTLGTVATGVWQGTAIADGFISSASAWNAKQNALVNSAGLAAALSDETGTGLSVFGTLPSFSSGIGVAGTAADVTKATGAYIKLTKTGLDLSTDPSLGISVSIAGGNTPAGEHLTAGNFLSTASSTSTNTGGPVGIIGTATVNTGITTSQAYAAFFQTNISGTTDSVWGNQNQIAVLSGGTVSTNALGTTQDIVSVGTINNATAFLGVIRKLSSGTITGVMKGLDLSGWSGSPATSYGIYMDSSIDRGTTKYAIYSLATSPSLLTGDLTVSGLLKTGSGPTTLTDAAGKILSAALNTVAVANGGTGASSAGIAAFNNITGYSASGATGTTSTNLVFSASPTFTGTPVLSTATATSVDSTKYTFNSSDSGIARVAAKVVTATSGGTSIDGWIVDAGTSRVSAQFDKTTNTTLADVTGLTANVIAGRTYTFRAVIPVTLDATGLGKVAIAGTATATSINYVGTSARGAGATMLGLGSSTALATALVFTTSVQNYAFIDGTITVNAGGTLTVQFAQSVSNGTSSVLVGASFTVHDTGS